MPRLATFYERHPEVAVHVMTSPQGAPELAPGVDIAARFGNGQWQDGSVTPLFAERIDPVASPALAARLGRSEEHTSELQSLMRISYAVFCLKKKNKVQHRTNPTTLVHSKQKPKNR